MRLSENSWRWGSLAAMLAVGHLCAGAQPAPQQQASQKQQQTSQQQAASQQQAIPDAPRPQTLPQLNTITPVAAAVPDAPQAQAGAAVQPAVEDNNMGAGAPGTSVAEAEDKAPKEEEVGPLLGGGETAGSAGKIVARVNFVDVPFTVKDSKGKLVPGLTWRDARVYENGVRQQMKVWTTDPAPISVALVIDQSVTFDTMEKINNSLAALQGAFTQYDEVAVFTYNNGVRAQGGGKFTAAQSARLGAVLERSKAKGRDPVMGLGGPIAQTTVINNQQVDPNTTAVRGQQGIQLNVPKEYHTLNDAILAAAQATSRAARGRRRIVFVISEGKEYGSVAKEKEVIKYLQTNKVAVYATVVGETAVPGLGFLDRIHLPLTMHDDVLPRYAAATGGQIDPEFRRGGIEASYAKITEEVRTQYTIGYYSHEPVLDGKFRKIEVRVLRPGLTVIAKEGYYPAASDNRPPPVTPTAVP